MFETLLIAFLVLLAGILGLWALRTRVHLRIAQAELEVLRDLASQRLERPAVLSHEIRTPLSLIQGAGELLQDESPGPLNPRQKEFIATITTNARQVIEMAEDFLSEARLEAELFELHLKRLDLRELARDVVAESRRIHPGVITMDAPAAPLWVDADRGLLRQALWNLVNNAARHAGSEVNITIQLSKTDQGAFFAVFDDGEGISPQDKEKLFTPFQTGGSRRPGTGLGLSITEKIVELHGGRIMVDTIAQRGSAIYFTLPQSQRLLANVEREESGK